MLLDILQLLNRVHLSNRSDVHVRLNRVRMKELVLEDTCLRVHLQYLHFEFFDADFEKKDVGILHRILEL